VSLKANAVCTTGEKFQTPMFALLHPHQTQPKSNDRFVVLRIGSWMTYFGAYLLKPTTLDLFGRVVDARFSDAIAM
jgi:hypothetical protein